MRNDMVDDIQAINEIYLKIAAMAKNNDYDLFMFQVNNRADNTVEITLAMEKK